MKKPLLLLTVCGLIGAQGFGAVTIINGFRYVPRAVAVHALPIAALM